MCQVGEEVGAKALRLERTYGEKRGYQVTLRTGEYEKKILVW